MQVPTIVMKTKDDVPDYNSLPGYMPNVGTEKDKMESLKHLSSLGGQYGFFQHVFDTSDSSKGEILNICQYALLAVIPVVVLNKLMARMIPDPDPDASSIELVTEIVIHIVVILLGMILIHRMVTYVPTWSQFRYEPFILTNSILVFLVIVMSLNTKLGLKCSMLYDRTMDYMGWGNSAESNSDPKEKGGRKRYDSASSAVSHHTSQADNSSLVPDISFPSLLPPSQQNNSSGRSSFGSGSSPATGDPFALQSANSLLGSAFN
jgi:hypothetical protein